MSPALALSPAQASAETKPPGPKQGFDYLPPAPAHNPAQTTPEPAAALGTALTASSLREQSVEVPPAAEGMAPQPQESQMEVMHTCHSIPWANSIRGPPEGLSKAK